MFVAASLSACTPAPRAPAETGAEPSASPGGAYVFQCERDVRFLVRVEGDSVRYKRGIESRTLPQQIAASGTRYSDGTVTFWSKGLDARLEMPLDTLTRCRGTRAESPWEISRLLGYEIWTIGQEPGWMVEVDPGRQMHVLAHYGEIEFLAGAPLRREGADGETEYHAPPGAHQAVLRVRDAPCEDVMSGERFPVTATLVLDDTEYAGCGMRLE